VALALLAIFRTSPAAPRAATWSATTSWWRYELRRLHHPSTAAVRPAVLLLNGIAGGI